MNASVCIGCYIGIESGNREILKNCSLTINFGEIIKIIGPSGAGKSTLINIICGINKKKDGEISVFGHDIEKSYKMARSKIGLVPQEIATDSFERVIDTLKFSRGLFNKKSSIEGEFDNELDDGIYDIKTASPFAFENK